MRLPGWLCFYAASMAATVSPSTVTKPRSKKVSCETCFFHSNMLCALEKTPCPTYRPDSPDGLRPPRQMRLVFRQERRAHVAFAFPTAQEQAARYQ